MPRAKQISVFMENRPGTIGSVLRAFSKSGVNLRGLAISDTVDHAVVRMVVSDTEKALELLEEANMLCLVHDIIEVRLDDKPGAFVTLADKLAEAKINIHFAYGSGAESGAATLFLRVDDADMDKADKLIAGKPGKKK